MPKKKINENVCVFVFIILRMYLKINANVQFIKNEK